jgi:hypothetical protein
VEDWEQFFEEKSRRRADVERRRTRISALKTVLALGLTAAAFAAAIYFAT